MPCSQHEMAHQWFGDSLTPRTWQGVWLNEGFAMYYQQWYETDMGRQPYGGGLPSGRSTTSSPVHVRAAG